MLRSIDQRWSEYVNKGHFGVSNGIANEHRPVYLVWEDRRSQMMQLRNCPRVDKNGDDRRRFDASIDDVEDLCGLELIRPMTNTSTQYLSPHPPSPVHLYRYLSAQLRRPNMRSVSNCKTVG